MELTGEHAKTARRVENMTPEERFAEFADTGNVAYLELWEEYEQATHGRQRISPAKELFRRLGVTESSPIRRSSTKTRAGTR